MDSLKPKRRSDHWVKRDPKARADYEPLTLKQTMDTFVYFLGSEDGTRIKIGKSGKKDWSRIFEHRKGDAFGMGGNFELLAVIRATGHAESYIHNKFRDHLVPGETEVFYAHDDIVKYIVWLRDNPYVSTTKAEFESDCGRKVMEPDAWLPDDQKARQSSRTSDLSMLTQMDPWARIPSRRITGDDWYTPEELVAIAKDALGGSIDLDPASNPIANDAFIRAREYFTIGQNSLTLPWKADRIFLNPPFSAYESFAEKVLVEMENGNIGRIVILGPTRILSNQYAKNLLRRVDAIAFVHGRYAMWGIQADSSPVDGWFLAYIGDNVSQFLTAVEPHAAGFAAAAVRTTLDLLTV